MAFNILSKEDTEALVATKLSDAPSDGTTYGRNNGAWTAVSGGGVSADKALANAIAVNIWCSWNGSYWDVANPMVNTGLKNGYFGGTVGLFDGTNTYAPFPADISNGDPTTYIYVSVNGTLSDFPVNYP